MSDRNGKPARAQRRRILRETRLSGLVSVTVLQRVQDSSAETQGVSLSVRDLSGEPVTRPSRPDPFCRLVLESEYGERRARESYCRALKRAAPDAEMFSYASPVGLRHTAVSIMVEGERVGCLVMSRPQKKGVSARRIVALARETGVMEGELMAALMRSEPCTTAGVARTKTFLKSVANTIGWLCVQGAILRGKLEEQDALFKVTSLLAATLDLRKVLKLVARSAVEVVGAKGCSVRLLDRQGKRLEIKSYYNLSRRYLDKGAVVLADSAIDQAALAGEVVQIDDMVNDPRVLYPEEARREGLHSGVSLGLIGHRQAVGTLHVYRSERGGFLRDEVRMLQALANHAAVAITNARLYEESQAKRRMERELRVAGEIQRQLLPRRAPKIAGFDIAAVSLPCHQVGGDFFDFVPTREGRTAVIIGDVAGKGVPAALEMASARAAIRAYLERTNRPSEAVHRLNVFLSHDIRGGRFVTLFCGVIEPGARVFEYCNGGHNPPLLMRDGETIPLETGGMVLGADEEEWYENGNVRLRKGDLLVFYTDGVTEAVSRRGELFGTERLMRVLRRKQAAASRDIVKGVREAIRRFARGAEQSDDITLIVARAV